MNDDQLLRYSRHILLDEIGVEGQEALQRAHALIIGAGGLGSPAAMYLAAAGVGTITLVDDDTVDLTNLQRQILHNSANIGERKVDSGREALTRLNPEVRVNRVAERVAAERLTNLVAHVDVVLDCSDNFATRQAVNGACVAAKKPLVSGAAIRFDGQIASFDLRRDRDSNRDAPCYHCLFPQGDDVEEVNCATMGVFAPLTGIIGTMQAAEALKFLIGLPTLSGRLLLLDARTMVWQSLTLPRDPNCAVCDASAVPRQGAAGTARHDHVA